MSRLVRLLVLLVATVLVVALAVHLPSLRAVARDRLATWLTHNTGAHVTLDALEYSLFSLRATARGLAVARPGHEASPLLRAERVAVDLGWRSVGRTWHVDAIEVDRPRLDLAELQRFLHARPSPAAGTGRTASLDSVAIGRLAVTGLELAPDNDAPVSLDLRGLSLAMSRDATGALAGAITLDRPSTLRVGQATTRFDRLDGTLALAGSQLLIPDLEISGPDLEASVVGEIEHLDATPRLSISSSAQVSAGLVAALEPRVPISQGTLYAWVDVNGPMASPTTQFEVTSDRLLLADGSAGTVMVTGAVDGSRLRIERAELTACGGTASFTGEVALGRGTATDTGELRWQQVDLAHVLRLAQVEAPGVAAVTSGRATFKGPLDSASRLEAVVAATLAPAVRANASRLAGRVDARLEAGAWGATVADGRLGDMRVEGRAHGRVAPTWAQSTLAGGVEAQTADVSAVLEQLATLGVDTSALAPGLSSGAGRVRAVLGGTLGHPTLDGQVALERLRVAATGDYSVTGGVRFDASGLALDDVRVTSGSNRVDGRVRVSPSRGIDGEFTARIDDIVALGAAMPEAYRPRAGTLQVSGRVSGTTQRPVVETTANATGIVVAGQRIDAATASLVLEGHTLRLDGLEVASGRGRSRAQGTYDLRTRTFVIDEVRVRDYPVVPVPADVSSTTSAPGFALSGTADLEASLHGRLDAASGTASIRLHDARWGDEALGEVVGQVSATEGLVRFDLQNEASGLSATGTVGRGPAWPIEARLDLRDGDVAHLARVASIPRLVAASPSGRADVVVAVSGDLANTDDLAFDVSVSAASLVVAGMPLSISAPASVRVRGASLLGASVEVGSGRSRARFLRASAGAPITITLDGELGDVSPLLPLVRGERIVATGPVRANLTVPEIDRIGDASGEVSCEGCAARLAGMPPLENVQLAMRIGAGRLAIDRASAQWDEATATATGSAPLAFAAPWLPDKIAGGLPRAAGPAELELALTGISASLARKVIKSDSLRRVDGVVDLSVRASADSPRLAAVTAQAKVTLANLQLGDVRLSQNEPAVVEFKNERLALHPWKLSGGGTDVTIAGAAEFDGVEPVYETKIDGQVNLRALNALVPGRVAGVADVHVAARGQPNALVWSGRIELADGAIVQRAQRIAIVDLEAALVLSGDRVRVERLAGRLNGGTVDAHGVVDLHGEGLEGRLTGTVRGAGFEMPPGTRHDIDADLQLTLGTTREISGTVTVVPATVRESLVGLAALADQFKPDPIADARSASRPPATPIALNIALTTADDLVFDSNDLRLSAYADLTIGGTVARPLLLGQVRARDEGEIFLLGRTWKLDASTVGFVKGAAGTEPRLAITGGTRIGSYEVQMRITGPPERLAVSLSSDPPLGRSDLTQLVMTGQVSSPSQTGGTDSTEKGGQQVATAISAEVLGTFGRAVGLDTVRIEQNSDDFSTFDLDPASRLTIGERIGEHFEVVYSQSLGQTDDFAWILIYRPNWRGLEARYTYRTNAAEAYEVRQELYFGGPGRRPQPRARRPPQPKVADVVITGVDASETAALHGLMKMKPGKRFDARDWQGDEARVTRHYRDRDRLLARVRASRSSDGNGITLRYDITPGPLARIEVNGFQPSTATLDAMRATWARVVLEEFLDEELARPLRLQLAQDGYFQPEIATRFQPLPAGEGRLALITVSTGPHAGRREFVIEGNQAVSTEELHKAIEASCRRLRCWVEPAVLRAPLQALYRTRGYLDAQVAARRPNLDDGTATLRVDVDEGRRFVIERVTATGANVLGQGAAIEAFGLPAGSPYEPPATTAALDRLRTSYYRAGFRDAEVTAAPTVNRDTALVSLDLRIREGSRSVLQEVVTAGRYDVKPGLLESVMKLPQTGVLDSVALDDAQQRLYDTGIFRSVDVAVEPVGTGAPPEGPDQPVRAILTLDERPRYRLRYGVQYGPTNIQDNTIAQEQASLGVTADLQRRNLFGLGINAGAGGFWSPEQYQFRVTGSATTFFGRFVNTTFTAATADQSNLVNTEGLAVLDHSDRAVLEQRWRRGGDRRWEFAYGYEFDSRRIGLELQKASTNLITARAAGLTGTVAVDARDNMFNPRKGWYHSSRIEGGPEGWLSDISFARYQTQQYIYLPLGPAVFASGLRFGTLDVNDELKYASILLRFKAGGSTTVRGYAQDSLSPLTICIDDECAPFGGNLLLIFNEELRFPIYRWFGGAVFADLGNTFEGLRTFAWGDLKLGTGFGLRLNTPVFVIRLDAGFPVPRERGGPRVRWYFAIGQAF